MNEIYSLTIKEYISIMNKQVYYLLSQDYYGSEIFDIQNKTDYLSEIREKDVEIIKIDTEEITNIFEVIKNEEERNAYTIIYIHKQDRSVFKVGNVIYLDFGMVSFYTKDINGKTDKIEVLPTEIIEKGKIALYNSRVEKKMKALIDLINDTNIENENYEKVKNCINSININT